MRKLAFGALSIIGLLLAAPACGGDDAAGDDTVIPIDSGVDADDGACNPVTQTGCASDEKCTWVTIDRDARLGVTKCVPNGTVPEGGNCEMGPDGETTGYDNCERGSYCIGFSASANRPGVCEQICTLSPDSCANGNTHACSRYNSVFVGGELGVCDFRCSPGPNGRRWADNVAACGSPNPQEPVRGCYGFFRNYSCSPAISQAVHGDCPEPVPTGGTACNDAFLNSCAPGYQLFQLVGGAEADLVCVANCVPQEVHSGQADRQTRKLGVPPHDLPTRGVLDNQFECRYLWYMQAIFQLDAFIRLELNDSGVAFNPSAWLFNDGSEVPSCVNLSNNLIDTNMDNVPDTAEHLYNGCAPLTELVQGMGPHKRVRGITVPDMALGDF